MAVYGPLLWVAFVVGLLCVFLGVAMLSVAIAAPSAYHVNLLDVQYWTLDRFGALPWVHPEREYASAATFTLAFIVGAALLGGAGALLLSIPGVLLG